MPTLLHLDSSPLEGSISRELTREFVRTWQNSRSDGTVIRRDLAANSPKPVDTTWIYSSHTPEPRARRSRRQRWHRRMNSSPSWSVRTNT
jgi:FMN-dependent NADH-azoreductase